MSVYLSFKDNKETIDETCVEFIREKISLEKTDFIKQWTKREQN